MSSHPLDRTIIIGAAMIVPIALYLVNPAWMYTPVGWLDSFIPIGIGLNYADPSFANDWYKMSRLPWNLYQYAFRNLFQENAAHLALHLSLFLANAAFCYAIGKNLFRRDVAAFLAIFTTAFPLIISAPWRGGSDYQSAMASPLFFGFVAAVSAYGRIDTYKIGLCAGAALVAVLSINSMYLQMAPAMILIAGAVVLDRGGRWRDLAIAFAWTLAGAVALVVLLGVVHASFGRGFLFFMPEVRWVLHMLGNPEADVWWKPLTRSELLRHENYGFLFAWCAVACIECARIAIQRRGSAERIGLAIHASFIIEMSIWTLWQVYGHHTTLLPTYFAHPLYGLACLSIAAVLHRYLPFESRRSFILFAVAFPITLIVAIVSSDALLGPLRSATQAPAVAVGLCFLAFYTLLTLTPATYRTAAAVGSVALLALAAASTADARLNGASGCRLLPEIHRLIITSSAALTRQTDSPKDIFVWAQGDEIQALQPKCRGFWGGRVSDIAFSFAMLGHEFLDANPWAGMKEPANIPAERLRLVAERPGALVAAFTSDRAKVRELQKRFKEAGVRTELYTRLDARKDATLPSIYVLRLNLQAR